MDYRCPTDIVANFATDELARKKGRKEHVEWVRKILAPKLLPGDRFEVFDANGDSRWRLYQPIDALQESGIA